MNLRSIVRQLPCGADIRTGLSEANLSAPGPRLRRREGHDAAEEESEGERRLWTRPTGLRFLSGGAKLPEALARSVTEY